MAAARSNAPAQRRAWHRLAGLGLLAAFGLFSLAFAYKALSGETFDQVTLPAPPQAGPQVVRAAVARVPPDPSKPSVLVVIAFGAFNEADPATAMCRENMQFMLEHLLVPPTCCKDKRVDFVINVVDDTPLTPGLKAVLAAQREGGAAAARYANVLVQHAQNMNDLCAASHVWRHFSTHGDAIGWGDADAAQQPHSTNPHPFLPSLLRMAPTAAPDPPATAHMRPYDDGAWHAVRPFVKQYDYYVITNCGMRGPYVPGCDPADRNASASAAEACASWVDTFTSALVNDTHVVGPTINCHQTQHVQSTALMVTAEVEPVVRSAFAHACEARDSRADTVAWGELGASRLALAAGYNLASLQPQYAGVDWTKDSLDPTANEIYRQCVAGANPQGCQFRADPNTLGCRVPDPYEQVFVKAGGDPLRNGWSTPGLVECVRMLDAGKTKTCPNWVRTRDRSVLVVVAYAAKDESDPATAMCRENMEYLVNHLLVPPTCCGDKRVDFVINVVDDTPLTPGLEAILNTQRGGMEISRYANVRIQHAVNMNDLCSASLVWRSASERPDAVPLNSTPPAPPRPYDEVAWASLRPFLPQYDYYMVTNCGMRGPYVSGCEPSDKFASTSTREACASWIDRFTSKLDEAGTHVVGPTLNCEPTPHVQSTALMVTAEAEPVVRSAFAHACEAGHDRLNTVTWGEVGASRVAMEAGYNLASLQPVYAGVDWRAWDPAHIERDSAFEKCRNGFNPQACEDRNNLSLFGCHAVDPYERVFVKTGGDPLRRGVATPGIVDCVRSLESGESKKCPLPSIQ